MLNHILNTIYFILGIAGFIVLIAYLAERKKRLVNAILFLPFLAAIVWTFMNK
jgi:uncharacterized membrane protein YuzA (DUF378 family)